MTLKGRSGLGMSANIAGSIILITIYMGPCEGVFLWEGTLNNDINT